MVLWKSKVEICRRCGRRFKNSSESKKILWVQHRISCGLQEKQVLTNHNPSSQKPNILPPYIIQDGFKCSVNLPSLLYERLRKHDICVIDNFSTEEVAVGVKNELKSLYITHKIYHKKLIESSKNEIRSDFVYWLSGKESKMPHVKILKKSINGLIMSTKFKDIHPVTGFSHFQASCFLSDSFGYDVHVDNPNDNGCLLTVQYFLNSDYKSEKDGGECRLFLPERRTVVDIEPIFNRLLIFWSDFRVAHGTRRCHRDLYSLSAWYFNESKT